MRRSLFWFRDFLNFTLSRQFLCQNNFCRGRKGKVTSESTVNAIFLETSEDI